MTISSALLPVLQIQFSEHGLRIGQRPDPIGVFPAINPSVGDVEIYDDGDGITLSIGALTHGHFAMYDANVATEELARRVTEAVCNFLHALFSDRVLLWSLGQGRSGGWVQPFEGTIPASVPVEAQVYVWSKRIR